MKTNFNDFLFDLQLFADGAAAGTSAGTDGGNAASTEGAVVTSDDGSNTAAEAVQNTRAEDFQKVRQEYKSEFDNEIQSVIRQRLKRADEDKRKAEDFKGQANEVFEILAQKYGGNANDIQSLKKAVEEDDSFYEDEAARQGLTVEQLKQFRKIERENKAFKEQAKAAQEKQARQQLLGQWAKGAEDTKRYYKKFDLEAEAKNPQFMKLLRSGVPVKTAYEVIHKDEIIPAAMQLAAQKTSEKISASVAAGQNRPKENGLSNNSSALNGVDINKLTKKQMDEYKKRARNGEKITFTDNNF